MFSVNEASIAQAAGSAASTVIRSLNDDFVRKGIVVDSAQDAHHALDPKIVGLVESLKGFCKKAGTREVGDITSAIQLWKERSLHHTLQTLDQSKKDSPGDVIKTGSERQIQAIELHEKAGREVREAVLRVLQNIIDAILKQIEGFTVELAVLIRELIKPEIEDELIRERAVTERLIAEKQRFLKDHIALQDAHAVLTKRMDEWETAEDGGGDALLCRKLREQVKQLKATHVEMTTKMVEMERQNEQWRYEMVTMKTELEIAHKTLAMTRAMHEKETKQLVELVHIKEDHFERVRQATTVAKMAANLPVSPKKNCAGSLTITSYDPLSGRSICYQSPHMPGSPAGPSKTTRTVLACLASPQPAASPNKKRIVTSVRPVTTPNRHDEEASALSSIPPSSPRGQGSRPISAAHPSTPIQ